MGGMSKTILPILRVRDSVSLIIQRQHHVKMGIRFPIGLLLKGQPLRGPLGYIRNKSPLGINYGALECLSVTCLHAYAHKPATTSGHVSASMRTARITGLTAALLLADELRGQLKVLSC